MAVPKTKINAPTATATRFCLLETHYRAGKVPGPASPRPTGSHRTERLSTALTITVFIPSARASSALLSHTAWQGRRRLGGPRSRQHDAWYRSASRLSSFASRSSALASLAVASLTAVTASARVCLRRSESATPAITADRLPYMIAFVDGVTTGMMANWSFAGSGSMYLSRDDMAGMMDSVSFSVV